ncbi:MAG: transposase [Gammaproteobacteria bacterium]|nr:transposase [Gammaproteobacteria bacterium]
MKKSSLLIIAMSLILVIGLIVMSIEKRSGVENDEDERIQRPAQPIKNTDNMDVHLESKNVNLADIKTSVLITSNHAASQSAYAEVLDITNLAADIARYQRLDTDIAKSNAALKLAQLAAERHRILHQDDHNVSDQALETAENAVISEKANRAGLIAERDSVLSTLKLNWGQRLIGHVDPQRDLLSGLLAGKTSLLSVSLPPSADVSATLPDTITIATPNGEHDMTVLGSAPHVNERLQGTAVLAISNQFLPVGMKLSAQWPQGQVLRGVLVPSSAVVWWQGLPWVYKQESLGNFQRVSLQGYTSLPEGWFGQHGLAAGDQVVTQGAQLLLSEEQRSSIKTGDDE